MKKTWFSSKLDIDRSLRGGVGHNVHVNVAVSRHNWRRDISWTKDWSWNGADWRKAFEGLDKQLTTILLSHQPSVLELDQTKDVSLILSGHTHGGQINLAWLGAPARFATKDLKYSQGLFRFGEAQLYVSSGTGVIGLPLRFGVRPEIAVLKLKRKLN